MGQSQAELRPFVVVSPQWGTSGIASLLCTPGTEMGQLGVETWGETLRHTLTREEEMPDADPERLHDVSLTRKPGNGKTLAAFEVEE